MPPTTYAPRVSSPQGGTITPTPESGRARFRRRPPASKVEQARRKAWGKTWGAVGHEYKMKRLAREGR